MNQNQYGSLILKLSKIISTARDKKNRCKVELMIKFPPDYEIWDDIEISPVVSLFECASISLYLTLTFI